MPERSDISTCVLFFSMRNHYRDSNKRVVLVQGRNQLLIKSNLFDEKAETNPHLALTNNHSLANSVLPFGNLSLSSSIITSIRHIGSDGWRDRILVA